MPESTPPEPAEPGPAAPNAPEAAPPATGRWLPTTPKEAARGTTALGAAAMGVAALGATALRRVRRTPQAERRQITAMFCDLVGAAELSAQIDAELLGQVVRAYQDTSAEVVQRFGGIVAKFQGDGVLVYFGYPDAAEDDAHRAVQAALGVIDEVGGLVVEDYGQLQTRVGLASGLAAVGDDADRERTIVGEAPDVAGRLQALAAPDRIVMDEATQALVEGMFPLVEQGPCELPGLAEPIDVWQLATGEETRPEANAAVRAADPAADPAAGRAADPIAVAVSRPHGGPLPLVGREPELAQLVACWEQVGQGQGQVVLLSGEAGIGKSRLLQAFQERLANTDHLRLRYNCAPGPGNGALYPVINQLEHAAGFERQDTPEQRVQKLVALLAQATRDVAAIAPLFAALLSLPADRRWHALELDPAQQKEATFAALGAQLTGLAAQRPVVMVIEDAHWIDPTSQELFARFAAHVAGLPVLLVATFRPDYRPPIAAGGHVTAIQLGRLGRDDMAAMAAALAGGRPVPGEVVDEVAGRTGGLPLFVEELTKLVLETGIVRDDGGRLALDNSVGLMALPATLHDTLLARLDHNPAAKEVAQFAAAIGQEFSHALVYAVAQQPEATLAAVLNALAAAELIGAGGTPSDATYRFTHAAVQEAAYGTMARGLAKQVHGRIAQVIATEFPALAETSPQRLAHHLTEAGDGAKAIAVWRRAAERSGELAASTEAVAHLTRALELAAELPKGHDRLSLELDLRMEIAVPLIAANGYSAAETEQNYSIALELCRKLGATSRLLPVLYGRWVHLFIGGAVAKSRDRAAEILKLADTQEDEGTRAAAHRLMGTSLLLAGEPETARQYLEGAMSLYDPRAHADLADIYGQDVGAAVLSTLALALWQLGYGDKARARGVEALKLAKSADHANTTGYAAYHVEGILGLLSRDWKAVERGGNDLVAFANEQDLQLWRVAGGAAGAAARAMRKGKAEQLDDYAAALDAYSALPVGLYLPLLLCVMAEAQAAVGQPADGLVTLDEAESYITHGGEHWIEPEVHRLRGELLLAVSPENTAQAEPSLRKALELAGAHEAKMLELRAAMSLARLRRDQGKSGVARAVLAPVFGWFTEGFKLPDLKDARDLLRDVG